MSRGGERTRGGLEVLLNVTLHALFELLLAPEEVLAGVEPVFDLVLVDLEVIIYCLKE